MKTLAAVLLAAIIAIPVLAEDAPAPSATPIPNPTIYYFALSPSMLNTIANALSELPKKIADPAVAELQKQINDQQKIEADRAAALKK